MIFLFRIKCLITRLWCFLTFGIPILMEDRINEIGWRPATARKLIDSVTGDIKLKTGYLIRFELAEDYNQSPIHAGFLLNRPTCWMYMNMEMETERKFKFS